MQLFLKIISGKANSVDPVWSGSALFAYAILLATGVQNFRTFTVLQADTNDTLIYNTTVCMLMPVAKILVRLFFSVWTVYLEKIMKTHLKIGLKDWNFVYHMVASNLKDCDKDFGIVC